MKVVVATTIGRTMSAFLREQIDELVERGHEVTLLCTEPEPVDDLVAAGIPLVRAPWDRPLRPWQWPRAISRVRRLLRDLRPELIYTHTAIASTIVRAAAATTRHRPDVVYCAHGFDGAEVQPLPRRLVARGVERLFVRVTDLLFVMNDEDEGWARTAGFSRVVRLPSVGLPLDRYTPTHPKPTGPYRLLVIAELAPRKRVHLAIDALARLDERFTLTVLGDGPLLASLRRRATELGVSGRVEFAGQVSDVRPYLDDAWLIVSASRQEGLPRGLLESLASGVPVVGLTARGVDDLLADGGGIVVRNAEPAALAAAIRDVADHPEIWTAASEAGLQTALRHDVRAIAPTVVDALTAAIGR